MSRALIGWPRLLAAVGAAAVLAFLRLHVDEALLGGRSAHALILLTLLLAAPIYLVASIPAIVAAAIPRLPERTRRVISAAALPVTACAAGVFCATGTGARMATGAGIGLLAWLIERPLASVVPLTHPARLSAGVALLLVLAGVPIARWVDAPTRYQSRLGTEGLTSTRNVVILGVDGVDWSIFNEYLDAGLLPNFARLANEGVLTPLRTLAPTSSPFIWNSIYTGFSPAVHHRRPVAFAGHDDVLIEEVGERKLPDLPNRLMRLWGWPRVRYPFAIWDILRSAGYETAVVGAWEDLPVPDEHAVFFSTNHRYEARWPAGRHLAMRPGRLAWTDPGLVDALRAHELPPRDVPESEWRRLFGDTDRRRILEAPYADEGATPVERRLARTRAVYASDRLRVGVTEELLGSLSQPFVLFSYIRGIDVVQHCYLHQYRGAVPDDEQELGDVIRAYHQIVDDWLGRVRAAMNPRDVLIVLSDHGFNVDEYQPHEYKTGFHDFAPDGVLLSSVRRDSVAAARTAHVYDVTPTILSLLGLPVLASMEGRVIPEISERTPTVSDWRTLTPAVYQGGDPEDMDPELIELLRSLGYL